MRKLALVPILVGLSMVLFLASCMTVQRTDLNERDNPREEAVVIDHKNKALGGQAPDWLFATIEQLDAKYADQYVFRVEAEGKDKDGAMMFLDGMQAPTEVARQVSLRVQNKFVGASVGDKDTVETYMENVTKSISQATITGMRKVDTYWVKLQEGKKVPYYRAMALYVVPQDEIDGAIARALDAESARQEPKTEEEKVARERVKEIFGEGMD